MFSPQLIRFCGSPVMFGNEIRIVTLQTDKSENNPPQDTIHRNPKYCNRYVWRKDNHQ